MKKQISRFDINEWDPIKKIAYFPEYFNSAKYLIENTTDKNKRYKLFIKINLLT